MASVQETLRRIKQEAKKIVAEAASPVKNQTVTKQDLDKILAQFKNQMKEQVSSALSKALIVKTARQYLGDLTEAVHDLRTELTTNLSKIPEKDKIVLPDRCKFLIQQDNAGLLVLEYQPQMRTIFDISAGSAAEFYLPMPYIIFIIPYSFDRINESFCVEQFGVGFRTAPLSSMDDVLYSPTLPHCDNTHVCQPMHKHYFDTIKELIDHVIENFWGSEFHYPFVGFSIGSKRIHSYAQWAKLEPLEILRANFRKGQSLIDLLKFFVVDGNLSQNYEISKFVTQIEKNLDAQILASVIQQLTENVLNSALKNVIGSALQQENSVV